MRALATCPLCYDKRRTLDANALPTMLAGELDDVGYVHVNCPAGHYSIVIYNARRYEVLIRSAANAFVDGYTNEVVAVMSAALERAYEFYIRVSCRASGIPAGEMQAAWKVVAAQSER